MLFQKLKIFHISLKPLLCVITFSRTFLFTLVRTVSSAFKYFTLFLLKLKVFSHFETTFFALLHGHYHFCVFLFWTFRRKQTLRSISRIFPRSPGFHPGVPGFPPGVPDFFQEYRSFTRRFGFFSKFLLFERFT